MFTGIVKDIGFIDGVERTGGDLRLAIRSGNLPWSDYEVGDSISVNGVCLTATRLLEDGFETDVSGETLAVTTLDSISVGDQVNLEPAMALGERMGGHLVSGHVDCIGKVSARADDARSVRLTVEVPEQYARYIAAKGSICIDGVSLTVNEVSGSAFGVNIIPHTAEVTVVGDYAIGSCVNIEVDLVARYVERLLASGDDEQITLATLREHGYA